MAEKTRGKGEDNEDEHSAANERIEWIVAAISAVIVLALFGFILFEAVTKTGDTPDIHFEIERGVAMSDGFALEVTAHNDGHVTVAGVQIEAEADLGGGESEVSSVTVDYLPAESGTEVGLVFSQEVDPERVRLRVLGYTYP